MIKIKRAYDEVSPDDGERILVDRLWPRGIKKDEAKIDEWMKEIAPSNELRKWFAHDPSKWKEFKKRYMEELKDQSTLIEILINRAKRGNITLIFSARETEHNNAVVLSELISKRERRKS
jgi:uncharacterized protein YeaO (DUF488 family)